MTEERQPNTELREACGRLFETICNLPEGHKGQCGWEPSSIQAEVQQQIERLEKGIKAFKEYEECAERQIKGLEEQAEAAEKHLAEAKKDALLWQEIAADYGLKRDAVEAEVIRLNEQLAEARAQLAEIHNRFCGENGEPCQVCRLKAEREGKP